MMAGFGGRLRRGQNGHLAAGFASVPGELAAATRSATQPA